MGDRKRCLVSTENVDQRKLFDLNILENVLS